MELIRQKIAKIKEYMKYIQDIAQDCDKKFSIDPVYRGALLYYLYLLADTCIVLAEMVIKKRDLRRPQSYSEAFDILADAGILDQEFAWSFAKIAGFRNFLAHDYEKIDAQKICQNILKKLPDVNIFLRQLQTALNL